MVTRFKRRNLTVCDSHSVSSYSHAKNNFLSGFKKEVDDVQTAIFLTTKVYFLVCTQSFVVRKMVQCFVLQENKDSKAKPKVGHKGFAAKFGKDLLTKETFESILFGERAPPRAEVRGIWARKGKAVNYAMTKVV